MTKRATPAAEPVEETVEEGGGEEFVSSDINLDKMAAQFMEALRSAAGTKDPEIPSIPNEGVVVVVKPNVTFAGQVWPAGTILDLQDPDPDHPLESDEHENAFLRAVRAGEEWTKEIALWFPKERESLEEAHRLSYQAYTEWLAELNRRSGLETLDSAIRAAGATTSLTDRGPALPGAAGPDIKVEQQPERIISIGARLGDDQ